MMKKANVVDWVAGILVLVGALNWGFVGFFDINFVSMIFGDMTMLTRAVYGLVGVAGLWMVYGAFKCSKSCSTGGS